MTNHDWKDALGAWVLTERERLGGPPTPEEVAAFVSGNLPPAEAERVRALLVYYPELTPLLDERPRRSPPRITPIAVGLMLAVLTAWVIESRWEITRMSREPYVHQARHELTAMRSRGPGSPHPYPLPPDEERYLLTATLSGGTSYADYRLDLGDEEQVVWSVSGIRPDARTFEVSIPRRRLMGKGS